LVLLLISFIPGIPAGAVGVWWGIHRVRVMHFEHEAMVVLAQAEPKEDLERQLFFHRWDDGSWILTCFREECCGYDFDAHVLRTSDAGMFIASGAHYCGVEGLEDGCRHAASAADFRQALERQHARLIPTAAPR
jgi:hypothetical protein